MEGLCEMIRSLDETLVLGLGSAGGTIGELWRRWQVPFLRTLTRLESPWLSHSHWCW